MSSPGNLDDLRAGAKLGTVVVRHVSALRGEPAKLASTDDERAQDESPVEGELKITVTLVAALAIGGTLVAVFELSAVAQDARYNVGALSVHMIDDRGDSTKDPHLEGLVKSFAETDAFDDVYPYMRSAVQALASVIETKDTLPVQAPELVTRDEGE